MWTREEWMWHKYRRNSSNAKQNWPMPSIGWEIIAILGDIAQARESLSINLQRLRTYVLELIVSCLVMVLVIVLELMKKVYFFKW